MPLSKMRDRQRKRLERVRIRLHKQLSSPHQSKSVQPNRPDLDADGNLMPDYDNEATGG